PIRPELTWIVPNGKPPDAIWPTIPAPDRIWVDPETPTFPETITEPETVAPMLPDRMPIKPEDMAICPDRTPTDPEIPTIPETCTAPEVCPPPVLPPPAAVVMRRPDPSNCKGNGCPLAGPVVTGLKTPKGI